ncbi:hypothetical protein [Roseivirga thermotolerans]|uniref:hypothetical protein n=1 Tax=Roseivirga thermotolerans TaxID=1758176 RepID=UPI00273DFC81|nr:hypothetical protein [Roseivirga thermotolerans]
MKRLFIHSCFILVLASCAGTQRLNLASKSDLWNMSHLSEAEYRMANELLSFGLEHEALYTLLDTLKPISSLGFPLSYPLAKSGEQHDGDEDVVDLMSDSTQMAFAELTQWNKVLSSLSNEYFSFHLIPFKNTYRGKRNLQLLVCRRDLMAKLLSEKAEFFGQWGFTSNSDPATVLTTIEYESRNDRYRAYGYLFGYPDHAVDFFVEASISQEQTGNFVERNFFHMPVAVMQDGYFTYAVPKDYTPSRSDSAIYRAALSTLQRYEMLKPRYIDSTGRLEAIRLLSDSWNKL